MTLATKLIVAAAFAATLCSAIGCKKKPPVDHGAVAEAPLDPNGFNDPHSVSLKLTRIDSGTDVTGTWAASYDGGAPLFQIVLLPSSDEAKSELSFGRGSIVSTSRGKAQPFLNELARRLEAKHRNLAVNHVDQMDITYAILGKSMSRLPDGGFGEKPRGDWTAMKIFLPTGDDEAEVFFNLNTNSGEAELSEKDADYGDDVLKAFSSLL